MGGRELERTIAELRAEIARVDDAAERERLRALVTRVEQRLTEAGEVRAKPLLDDLRHFVESVEANHPRLTSIVNDVMMKLANIGI